MCGSAEIEIELFQVDGHQVEVGEEVGIVWQKELIGAIMRMSVSLLERYCGDTGVPPLVPSLRIERAGAYHFEDGAHIVPCRLRVRQDVAALLAVHACHAISAILSAASRESDDVQPPCTHSKLLCSLNAMGASGVTIVSHAFCTSTSRMALRETRFSVDLEPSVATSHTVATPYLRLVRTVDGQHWRRGLDKVPTRTGRVESGTWNIPSWE